MNHENIRSIEDLTKSIYERSNYVSGFPEWPKATSAESLMDISSVLLHLLKAQDKTNELLEKIVENTRLEKADSSSDGNISEEPSLESSLDVGTGPFWPEGKNITINWPGRPRTPCTPNEDASDVESEGGVEGDL